MVLVSSEVEVDDEKPRSFCEQLALSVFASAVLTRLAQCDVDEACIEAKALRCRALDGTWASGGGDEEEGITIETLAEQHRTWCCSRKPPPPSTLLLIVLDALPLLLQPRKKRPMAPRATRERVISFELEREKKNSASRFFSFAANKCPSEVLKFTFFSSRRRNTHARAQLAASSALWRACRLLSLCCQN